MAKKLTTATATDMVGRIESLHRQIDEVYAEARGYDGTNNDSVIRDAVKARRDQREAQESAKGLLDGFDVVDE